VDQSDPQRGIATHGFTQVFYLI